MSDVYLVTVFCIDCSLKWIGFLAVEVNTFRTLHHLLPVNWRSSILFLILSICVCMTTSYCLAVTGSGSVGECSCLMGAV